MPSVKTVSLDEYLEQGGPEPAAIELLVDVDRCWELEQLLARLSKEDRALWVMARAPRRIIKRQEIADQLGVSRFALYRRLQRIEERLAGDVARRCRCGEPLPAGSTRRRRFCPGSRCRVAAYRARRP